MRSSSHFLLLLFASSSVACASSLHAESPPVAPSSTPTTTANASATPPAGVTRSAEKSSSAPSCFDQLLAHDVAFVPLRYSRGIAAPVQLDGSIAGVSYRPTARFALVVDCRFAVVLAGLGPLLREQGVSTLEFSIAHAYRSTRAGRLSLQASGLALDVHGVVFDDGGEETVQKDFSRQLGARGCDESSRRLNQLACQLKRSGKFSEILTPDDNRDHEDHFHLGISRQEVQRGTLEPTSSRFTR